MGYCAWLFGWLCLPRSASFPAEGAKDYAEVCRAPMDRTYLGAMKPSPLCLLLSAALALTACQSKTSETTAAEAPAAMPVTLLTPGPWRGKLAMQEAVIPFLFEVKMENGQPVLYLINKGLDVEQRLRCPKITQAGDSVTVRMPAANAALVLRADGADKLKGAWVKYNAKPPFRLPLTAMNEKAYLTATDNSPSSPDTFAPISGTWRVTFKKETGQTYPAVGIFRADTSGWNYTGSFLTSTGNYRYLTQTKHI